MPRTFALPDLGEGITEAQVIKLLVKSGDPVAEDQPLMEVETDKAAVEIPSPFAGIASQVHVKEGQTINVGAVVVTFDDAGGKAAAKSAAQTPAASAATSRPAASVAPPAARGSAALDGSAVARRTTAPAAPAVRKLARELGVDLDAIVGTGPGSRVTREDVERAASGSKPSPAPGAARPSSPVSAPAPSAPTRPSVPAGPLPGIADADKWGSIRREPISQIRKTIANQMSRSAYTAVHVTHSDEVDITELDRLRRQLNELTNNDPKLTVMAFVIRAVCLALRKHPIFNSSFDMDGGQIIHKDYINVGVAVDTERGLIVPVIRNADRLSLRQITGELRSIADRVRANRFDIEDLRGGTFTITNVGALGGMWSTPIINHPEVAILGLGRSRKVPMYKGDAVVPALMMPVNLSFDHRATDGANTARFCGDVIAYLENPVKFLLE